MNKNIKFIMAAAAAIAMIGCARDGGNNGPKTPAPGTEPSVATVTVTQDVATRAEGVAGDFAANPTESSLKQVDLFVFDSNKQLEQVVSFTTSDLAAAEPTKSFETTNGLHTLIVIANQPAWMKTNVAAFVSLNDKKLETPKAGNITMYSDFLTATTYPAWTDQATFETAMGVGNTTQGLLITSVINGQTAIGGANDFEYEFEVPTELTPNPTANNITINLGRAFAKATADWDNIQPTDASGTVSQLEFAVLNNPVKSYGAQHIENGIYKAAWHDLGITYVPTNYYDWVDGAGVPATAWKVANGAANATYVPENTNPQIEGHRTAFGFKATFAPAAVYKTTLASAAATGDYEVDGTWAVGASFFRIKGLKAIAGVPASAIGWKNVYFSSKPLQSDATQMAVIRKALGYTAAHQAIANPVEGTDFAVYEYVNSACYYYLGLEDENKPVATTNVGRNEFFWVNIETIATIGEPTLTDATPEPTTPLTVPVNITAKISVQPWVGVNIPGNI